MGGEHGTEEKFRYGGRIWGFGFPFNPNSCLAVTGDGLVLGLLDQCGYNRPEPKDESASHENKKVGPIEEKERYRWFKTLERSRADIPEGVRVITLCDREGDMAD